MKYAKRIAAAVLPLAILLAAAGCAAPKSGTGGVPDGFVDNMVDADGMPEDRLYLLDTDEGQAVLGAADGAVYMDGEAGAFRLAANMICTEPEDADDAETAGVPAGLLARDMDRFRFGDRAYSYGDLVRPRTEGLAVLEMLAADYGLDLYSADEDGNVYLAACLGKDLRGDDLRDAYSERADFENYTVCVYYLHARMSGMDADSLDACRSYLDDNYGIDHSSLLDGTLAVMLYYGLDGYDLFYTVAASAPCHYGGPEEFQADPSGGGTSDGTACHIAMKDGTKICLANQVFIRCDQDEAPAPWPDASGEERTEAGDAGGTGNMDPGQEEEEG